MAGPGGPVLAGPPLGGRPVLLLTNYRGGGIGDFGEGLAQAARAAWPDLEVEETRAGGGHALRQAVRSAFSRKALLANVGLTAWGTSGVRNLLGFQGIRVHRSLGRPTIAIVHHTIEMFGSEDSGYHVSRLVRWGARWATRSLRGCDLVAFSPRVAEALRNSYGARSVWLTPLPGGRPVPRVQLDGPAKVASVGYWAPYKGIDTFLEVAGHLRERAQFILAGTGHPLLAGRSPLREQIQAWRSGAEELGVQIPGYLKPEALSTALEGRTVGLLPYGAASGASAAFSLFVERGIPVVSSDLPEFRYLASEGAGILPVRSESAALTEAVRSLLEDPVRWADASRRQIDFGTRNNWDAFIQGLDRRWSGDRDPPA